MKFFTCCVVGLGLLQFTFGSFHRIPTDELKKKSKNQNLLNAAEGDQKEENKIFLELVLNDLLKEEEENEKIDALKESMLLNNELGLTPAEELDSLGDYLTDGGGVWLDDPVMLDNALPPNYHNVTETRTKIGGNDVDVKQIIDKNTGNNGESTFISEEVNSAPEENQNSLFTCSLSRPCTEDEYCFETKYESVCLVCQEVGSGCIDDAQCCARNGELPLCVNGICKANVEAGSEGTICENFQDCQDGLCCAGSFNFPQRLCKPLARISQQCSPVLPGVESGSLLIKETDYFCPCEAELECKPRPSIVYKLKPLKYIKNYFCSPTNDKEDEEEDDDYNQVLLSALQGDSRAPLSNRKFADLYSRLLQQRSETEDDQRFLNPISSQLHHGMKESAELDLDPEM